MSTLKENQGKRLVSKFNEEENKKLDRQITKLVNDIKEKLLTSKKNIDEINYEKCENPSDQIMKNNMKIHLITKVQELTKEVKKNETQYLSKFKEFIGDEVNYNQNNYTQSNQLGLIDIPSELKEREIEINSLVNSIEELGNLMKDFQMLVIQQGSILDRIDYNIDEAFHNTKKAHVELKEANENMKGNCARNAILFLIVVIFFEALLLLLKYT